MRNYRSLPIDKLVSNVAVDPVHVRELADSIKVSGPISPILVREETLELIDGYHRVAAMKELGFREVECILTPCDDETFWDLRIMSATLHKAVTFARAVDWIEEVFQQSSWTKRYKSAYSLFTGAADGGAPNEVQEWGRLKASKWGLSLNTIRQWLYGKQTLAPDLYEEARQPREGQPSLTTYINIAKDLPGRPELQRQLVRKVRQEELSTAQTREVAQALRRAEDEGEVKTILQEPVSRTAEELSRTAKVERLITNPPVPQAREIIERAEMATNVLEIKLEWERVATLAEQVDFAVLDSLSVSQREGLFRSGERCIQESQKVLNYLAKKAGRMIELPR